MLRNLGIGRALEIALALALGIAVGCTPALNWREFRSPDGFAVILPGRPQTVNREVILPDAVVQMSVTSTGVGATLFAVGTAQLPAAVGADAAARQRSLARLRDSLVRNVNGRVVREAAFSLALPAGDPRRVLAAEQTEATGSDAKGRAVRLAVRVFLVDDRVFQLVALGAEGEISPDVLDTFFTSFRFL